MRISDWSSDVCSYDLVADEGQGAVEHHVHRVVEIGALGVLAQRDMRETVEGGADFGVGHAGEAWIGSDRTILPGVGSQACRKSRAARLSLVGRGARLNVGANVLGGKIKEEASAAGRRRGTFAPKGIRTRAHQFADAADRKSTRLNSSP